MSNPLASPPDGLERRHFTNADVRLMVEAGLWDEADAFELIDGDLIAMNAEYDPHFWARLQLHRRLMAAAPEDLIVATEASLFLADDIELRPDVHVFATELRVEAVRGEDVRLACEVIASTHQKDFEVKLPLYARHGVHECWYVDLDKRRMHVFRAPQADGRYAQELVLRADQCAMSEAAPGAKIALQDLLRPA